MISAEVWCKRREITDYSEDPKETWMHKWTLWNDKSKISPPQSLDLFVNRVTLKEGEMQIISRILSKQDFHRESVSRGINVHFIHNLYMNLFAVGCSYIATKLLSTDKT